MSLSIDTLRKVQASSGILFGNYLILHLTNTLVAHFGPSAYDGLMAKLRIFYQNPLVEPLFLVGALMHISSSVLLLWKRRKSIVATTTPSTSKANTLQQLHSYAGWALATFFAGHVLATRVAHVFNPLWKFDFLVLSFALYRAPYIFYPYYIALGVCGFYHATYGIPQALAILKRIDYSTFTQIVSSQTFKVFASTGALLMASAVIMFTDGFRFAVDKTRWPVFDEAVSKLFG